MEVANPASALGEAIGHLIEIEIRQMATEIARNHNLNLQYTGEKNGKKLLMSDRFGNSYDIDMAIFDNGNPIILMESKYLRYKKHMRDKGSWICVAHSMVQQAHPTIRGSIAVIIGDWTKGAKNLLRSFDITLLEIPFNHLVTTLAKYGVDFQWKEKERDKALIAWKQFNKLSDSQKKTLSKDLASIVESPLKESLDKILSDESVGKIKKIELKVASSTGANYIFDLNSIQELDQFLKKFDFEKIDDLIKEEKKKKNLEGFMK